MACLSCTQESFRKEIELLQSCNHDNIVGFRAACTDAPGHLMLVMEVHPPVSEQAQCSCRHLGTVAMHLVWC